MAKTKSALVKVKSGRVKSVAASHPLKVQNKRKRSESDYIPEPRYYDPRNRGFLLRHCRPLKPLIHRRNHYKSLLEDAAEFATALIQNINQYALVVTTNLTLEEHKQQVEQYTKASPSRRASILAEADSRADELFADIASVPFTTLIYSSDQKLLFLYIGLRPLKKRRFTLEKFRSSRTITADYVAQSNQQYESDRLLMRHWTRLWVALQSYACVMPPEPMIKESKRHFSDVSLFSSHVHPYRRSRFEWRMVRHVMHCWPQKGHANALTPMTPSAASTATQHLNQQVFIERTQLTTTIASALYQAFWPKIYKRAMKTFKAGRVFPEDCGPWLGRALGYKVQTTTHPDEGDIGVTCITSAGCFTGGQLQIHNLELQFTYAPGDMCLGLFSHFFHRVSTWSNAKPGDPYLADAMTRHNLTKGRTFLVLFNKADTAARLKGKPADWGRMTCFGTQEFV